MVVAATYGLLELGIHVSQQISNATCMDGKELPDFQRYGNYFPLEALRLVVASMLPVQRSAHTSLRTR
eukprot:3078707-Amphidinium_carterae.1